MFKSPIGVTFLKRAMTRKALHGAKAWTQSAVALFDEALVEAVLVLARESTTTKEQVDAAFSKTRALNRRYKHRSMELSWRNADGSTTTLLDMRRRLDLEPAQHWVRTWLPKVAHFDRLARGERVALLAALDGKLQETALHLHVTEKGLSVIPAGSGDSLEGFCARAFLPFVIPGGWSPHRLAQCQYENCGQWFLRPKPKRGSVPLYCSRKHANLARVRAFREKHKHVAVAHQAAAKHK
jgi:hypothetical protein